MLFALLQPPAVITLDDKNIPERERLQIDIVSSYTFRTKAIFLTVKINTLIIINRVTGWCLF